jgi:tetratricopeptide (TPR) repeat protein
MNLNKQAEAADIRKYFALIHELKLAALAELGIVTEAIDELETAVGLADNIHYQPIRWGSRYQLVDLYRQIGLDQEAQIATSEVVQVIHNIAARLTDESLRATFLHSQKSH